jgi:hypothetical protein
MSSPYHDVTPYLTSAGTVGTTTHVRQFHGVYPGIVISNTDPQNQNRITMYVPQFLGTAQSGWAMPMIGILVAPQPGELVYASFMGGDVSQPVYINASQKQLNSTALAAGTVPTITFSNTQPATANQGDLWFNTAQGSALSQFQNGAWVPYQFGTEAIAASAITAKEIAVGALDAQSINAPSITAGTLTAAQIVNAPFPANSQTSIQGSQISLSSAGGVAPVGTNAGGSMLIYQTAPTSQTVTGNFGVREELKGEYEGRYGDVSGTFTVPAGITSLQVQLWGGGGGGDANCHGGGGGEYIHEPNYEVVPLSTLSYIVGNGGVGGGGVNSNTFATNGNITTLSGGSVNGVPTTLIAYGGGAVGDVFQPGPGFPTVYPALGGGVLDSDPGIIYGAHSPDHGEAAGGNGGYNTVLESSYDYNTETFVNFNGTLVAPGGGGGAGGPTGPGQSAPPISTGYLTSGAGGLGNSPGGNGGTADLVGYDSGQGDYYSYGNNGTAPGGGGSGAWNGYYEEYNIFGGYGAGGQMTLNWQATGAQMIGSIAASAGTDTSGNSYPAGFAGESLQLNNQGVLPYSPTSGTLLYGAGGRPWSQSPSGTGLPIACSNTSQGGLTVNASTSAQPLTNTINIPANDANPGSGYRMISYGYGSSDGASLIGFQLVFAGVAITGESNNIQPTGGVYFSWEATAIVTCLTSGASGSATGYLSGSLSNVSGTIVASPFACLTNTNTVNFTAIQDYILYASWNTTGGSYIICNATVFERIGT